MTHPIKQFRIKSILEGRDLYFDTLKPQASSELELGFTSLVPCVIIELADSLASEYLLESQAQALHKINASAVVSGREPVKLVDCNDTSSELVVDCYVVRTEVLTASIEMAKSLLPENAYAHIKNHELNLAFKLKKTLQKS